jgi:hypothetical protein
MVRKVSVACVTYILQEISDFEPFDRDPPKTQTARFSRAEPRHMPVSVTTPGRTGAGDSASTPVALPDHDAGGTLVNVTFAAQWMA